MNSKRIETLRAILTEKNLDGLMLTGAVSRLYAGGLRTSAGTVLFTGDKNVFITDFRYIEEARAMLDGLFTVEMSSLERKTTDIIKEHMKKGKRLGIEADVLTLKTAEGWEKSYKLIPVEDEVRKLRAVKDADELEAMRQAQRIAEKTLEDILPLIRPGITERGICAEIVYRLIRNGAEKTSFDPIVASGANGSKPHAVPGDRTVEHGDFVTLDFGCVFNGYCSDMTRTVAVGDASEEMRSVYRVVLEAQEAGLAAAKADVIGKEIDAAARAVIREAGYGEFFGHGFGHGIGLEIHETPNANPAEEKPLPAGAVISAEPGIYLPGKFGVRIEDVIVLTESGYENLTKAPKELTVL
jgi:Xaa-Pro aminopeptidase